MKQSIVLKGLKNKREALDLTQAKLSEWCDVNIRTIQRIESGKPTSLATAKDIASALRLGSYTELIEDDTPVLADPFLRDFIKLERDRRERESEAAREQRKQAWCIHGVEIGALCVSAALSLVFVAIVLFKQVPTITGGDHADTQYPLFFIGLLTTFSMMALYSAYKGGAGLHAIASWGIVSVVLAFGITISMTGVAISIAGEYGLYVMLSLVTFKASFLRLSLTHSTPSIYDDEIKKEIGLLTT